MMFFTAWAFLLVALAGADSDYHDPNFSGNHGVIVHLFEWKWIDIALECERFLGPKGFGGVQVSPPNENLMVPSRDRPWWERYQPISYKLITRSGNEAEFGDMCKRCNAVGVRIYVDAIINHMTGTWVENIGTGGSLVTFAEWDFPGVPYTKADFNQPICDIGTYHNATEVRNCQLQGLKDLNQRIPSVRTKIIDFMNHLLTLGVAGFRIDAAKHMWPEDLKVIYDSLRDLVTDQGFAPGTRPFIFQEVIDLGGEDVHREEYLGIGRVTEMRYGFNIGNLFRGNLELRKLINWGGPYVEPGGEWFFMDHKDVIVFVDNHDTQRGGLGGAPISYKMKRQYQAANAFMLAHPFGLPKVMSSFDFDNNEVGPPSDSNFNTISPTINDDGSCGSGWVCEHRWPAITQMVIFRNTVGGGEVTNWWDNENNQIAFCVGKRGFAAFNNEGRVLSENLDTGMPAGTYCDVITGKRVGSDCSGKKVVVDGSGRASIEVSNDDMAMAFHVGPESNLGASELDTTSTSSTSTSTSTTTQNPGTDPEPGCGNGMEVKATYEGATWSGCLYSN